MHATSGLKVSLGAATDKGRKVQNEDAIGALVPQDHVLSKKGLVLLIADGVSNAEAGKEASETCVKNFLSDYFSTPDSWSVKQAALRVLTALNNWLHGQSLSYFSPGRGYISTLSTLIIKSNIAHIFHIGDSRIYRLRDNDLELLTHDHRTRVEKSSRYLTRAMGMDLMLDVDYSKHEVKVGDIFLLSTDGLHDVISSQDLKKIIKTHLSNEHPTHKPFKKKYTPSEQNRPLDMLSALLIKHAIDKGSKDNLSCQLLRIESVPDEEQSRKNLEGASLKCLGQLSKGMKLDGFRILDLVSASNHSNVYRVEHIASGMRCVLKALAPSQTDNRAYVESFPQQALTAKRIDNAHVVKHFESNEPQSSNYYVMDDVAGKTLSDWMKENPKPSVERAINILRQLVDGLPRYSPKRNAPSKS